MNGYLNYRYTGTILSSAYTALKSHISGINIVCILRFVKNCTGENKDTTFDHKMAKFDTRENFPLYGIWFYQSKLYIIFLWRTPVSHFNIL